MARARRTQTKSKPSPKPAASTNFKCPECGKTFTRAAALGAHRSRVHGIAGATRKARTAQTRRSRGTTPRATAPRPRPTATLRARRPSPNGRRARIDRDALLQTLFPNGVPAREAVIREANTWLDQAERLARMK